MVGAVCLRAAGAGRTSPGSARFRDGYDRVGWGPLYVTRLCEHELSSIRCSVKITLDDSGPSVRNRGIDVAIRAKFDLDAATGDRKVLWIRNLVEGEGGARVGRGGWPFAGMRKYQFVECKKEMQHA